MAIGGWTRLGIVGSVLWALGAGWHENQEIIGHHRYFYNASYETCTILKDAGRDPEFKNKDCFDHAWSNSSVFLKDRWANVAFMALAPIPIGWLFIYGCVRLFRWIRAGFKPA